MEGLSSLSLSESTRAVPTGVRTPFVGKTCEWIDISKVRLVACILWALTESFGQVKSGGQNCGDGTKFVIKQEKGTRKQFLFVDGKNIIAFVKNKEKFVNCSSFTEVTEMVQCKVMKHIFITDTTALTKKVDGVERLNLEGTSSSSPAPSPPSQPGQWLSVLNFS